MFHRRGLTLDYSASEPGGTPAPVTDDRYTVNDFTASRLSGSSARSEADDGRPLQARLRGEAKRIFIGAAITVLLLVLGVIVLIAVLIAIAS